jgi:pimeloyl-ACP methyl ester carboxylesterase
MLVSVGDVRLFVDVDGAKLVPDGMTMRERPTVVLLHGGPGFDHTPFKAAYASLAEIAQVVYYDHRGNGRSEHGPRERWNLDQWADDLRTMCSGSSAQSSSAPRSAASWLSTTPSVIPTIPPS